MFSSAFSTAFVRPPVACVGPMMAQAALADGAAWEMWGRALVIGGRLLVGPAGKVYAFASPETAAKWASNAAGAAQRERLLMATIDPAAAAGYKAKKRAKLAVIAARLCDAAARQHEVAKRAALLAESDYCLSKWGAA